MNTRLRSFKGKRFIGVAELAETAAKILEDTDSQQEKGTVTEYPDERTVRFYLSEGLIPSPSEKQGTASVFHYVHLLALLTVKKLQSEFLPIRKIREIIQGKTEDEFEKLLDVDNAEKSKDKNDAQQFLETLLLTSRPRERKPSGTFHSRPHQPPAAPPNLLKTQEVRNWKRIEITSGLEIHIEENFKTPSGSKELQLLLEQIRQIIESA